MKILHNQVRNYSWGSPFSIPNLLGTEVTGLPQAEVWLGAHKNFSSKFFSKFGDELDLAECIALDPVDFLGEKVYQKFGANLPFLLKILAADQPLSLQVHPNKQQAREGFLAEEEANISLDCFSRNYKDLGHKPEMLYALTSFEALCGFSEPTHILDVLQNLAEGMSSSHVLSQIFGFLRLADSGDALREAFTFLISGGDDVLSFLAKFVEHVRGNEKVSYVSERQLLLDLVELYPNDPGVLLALMLNRVSLLAGESFFVPAGSVHAYLCGVGVEVMANSDNVLRGGLTKKHVDVVQLLKVVNFVVSPVSYVPETQLGNVKRFVSPFEEFLLEYAVLCEQEAVARLTQNGPVIVLVVSGVVKIVSNLRSLVVERGGSVYIPANEKLQFLENVQDGKVFSVTVG